MKAHFLNTTAKAHKLEISFIENNRIDLPSLHLVYTTSKEISFLVVGFSLSSRQAKAGALIRLGRKAKLTAFCLGRKAKVIAFRLGKKANGPPLKREPLIAFL